MIDISRSLAILGCGDVDAGCMQLNELMFRLACERTSNARFAEGIYEALGQLHDAYQRVERDAERNTGLVDEYLIDLIAVALRMLAHDYE